MQNRCQNMSKPKQSSWFLNLLMLIIGLISILLAVMNYLYASSPPAWWPLTGPGTAAFSAMISLPIGVWMFIAALGLWREQEWAYGASLVCFTVIIFSGLVGVVTGIMTNVGTFFGAWPNWVAFIIVLIAVVGFLYLLFTMNRYS